MKGLDQPLLDALGHVMPAASVAAEVGLQPCWMSQYYECRLAPDSDRIDYLCSISRSAAVVAHEQLVHSIAARPASFRAQWKPVVELFRRWADGESLLSTEAPAIWLEFDDPLSSLPMVPTPSISVCLMPTYRTDEYPPACDADRSMQLIRDVMSILSVEDTVSLTRDVASCFARLPPSGRWIHVSIMLGRVPRALKLYGAFRRDEVLPYLRTVEWAGDYAAIERAFDDGYARDLIGDDVYVDLNIADFHDRAACTLGLAIGQQHLVSGPDADPLRRRILDRWTRSGLCAPSKAGALALWLCPESEADETEGWPVRTQRLLDLKLVWHAQTDFISKAYLGARRSRAPF
jgi:hypothetical protein